MQNGKKVSNFIRNICVAPEKNLLDNQSYNINSMIVKGCPIATQRCQS